MGGPALRCRPLVTAAALLLVLAISIVRPLPAWGEAGPDHFLCDGVPLSAQIYGGAVDAVAIPNTAGGTAPGAFVVLQWGAVSLQLPRTNNAGTPSFSDGKWWWSVEDPQHPTLQLRRGLGEVQRFCCEPAG